MSKIIENYLLSEAVGQGQYGKVYKASHMKIENSTYAVKTIKLEKFKTVPKLNQFTLNEIQTLGKIKHLNIVGFTEMLRSSNNIYLVYEFCCGGTLEDRIKKHKFLSEDQSLLILAQISKAFKLLAKDNILHRDLKPQNLLFDQYSNVKVADFGFCKTLPSKNSMTHTMVGSPIYMAPELLKGYPYNLKADVWSLGVVLYEMLFGVCPFEEKTIQKLIQKINTQKLHIPRNKNNISKECEQLLHQLLSTDVRARLDWDQLYEHSFLKKYIQQADQMEQQTAKLVSDQLSNASINSSSQLQRQDSTKSQQNTITNKSINNNSNKNNISSQQQITGSSSQNTININCSVNQGHVQNKVQRLNSTNSEKDVNINQNQAQLAQQQQLQQTLESESRSIHKMQQELKTFSQERGKVIYQLKVTNSLLNLQYHVLCPILSFMVIKNCTLMVKKMKKNYEILYAQNQNDNQKESQSSNMVAKSQEKSLNILKGEINQLEQGLEVFQRENLSLQKENEIFNKDKFLCVELLNNSILNKEYFKQLVLKYIDFLLKNNDIQSQKKILQDHNTNIQQQSNQVAYSQDQNNQDQQYNLSKISKEILVHCNEILDCLLIEDLYDSKSEDSLKLNVNLIQHENKYLQELLAHKISYAQLKDFSQTQQQKKEEETNQVQSQDFKYLEKYSFYTFEQKNLKTNIFKDTNQQYNSHKKQNYTQNYNSNNKNFNYNSNSKQMISPVKKNLYGTMDKENNVNYMKVVQNKVF